MTKIQQWLAIAVVAILAIVAAGWFLMISPQKSKAAGFRTDTASELQANQSVQSQVTVLAQQEADVPAEQAQIAAILQKIPDNPAMPNFIRTLTAAAKVTGVELMSIGANPAAAVAPIVAAAPAVVASGAAAAPAAPASSALALDAVPLSLSFNGSYFQVQQFLAAVEKFPRTTLVTSVQLAPGAGLSPPVVAGAAPVVAPPAWSKITATISLDVFTNGSASAVTAAVAAAASAAASASPALPPGPSASASASASN
jgi:Tfp pilus assembly protein PilO